jgi:hypothetical protein
LFHTGFCEAFDTVRAAVAEVLDPKRLAYVILGHFEADECGADRSDGRPLVEGARRHVGASLDLLPTACVGADADTTRG